jgi:type I restriction enzyme, S subunit
MADEWRTTKFQTLIDERILEIGDGYRAKLEELGSGGPIFLRAGHVSDTHIDFNEVEHFKPELAGAVRSKMSQPGDTIITTKGNSTGRTSFVASGMPPFVYSPHLSYWRSADRHHLEPGFLRYWSKGDEFIGQLHGMMESTDMAPYLSLTDQRQLTITLPPIGTQRAIARVLGTLDDKLELNRRMNATLEGLARAVFRSWFVDFDPVVAKASGRRPVGMSADTAALFPKAFEDSPLGPIPKGWAAMKWGDIATLEYGKGLRGYEQAVGQYRVFGTNGPIGWHTDYLSEGEGVIVGRKGAYRGVHYSPASFFVIDTAFYLAENRPFSTKWAFFEIERNDIGGMDSGSAIPSTSRSDFYQLDVCLPPEPVMKAFEEFASPLFARQSAMERENRTLASLRDALLPRLLSGELRLKDAELLANNIA